MLHAGVLVADTARSLGFYRDVLGMQLDDSRPDLGYPGRGYGWGDNRFI